MSCGVGPRRAADPAFLYVWCRLAPIVPIPPPQRAAKKKKKKKKVLKAKHP